MWDYSCIIPSRNAHITYDGNAHISCVSRPVLILHVTWGSLRPSSHRTRSTSQQAYICKFWNTLSSMGALVHTSCKQHQSVCTQICVHLLMRPVWTGPKHQIWLQAVSCFGNDKELVTKCSTTPTPAIPEKRENKKWKFSFFHQRHALLMNFDIFVVTYRVTNFLPKLVNMPLFSAEKNWISIFCFPLFLGIAPTPEAVKKKKKFG